MVDKVIENNRVSIIGEIVSDFRYSHQVYGEGFYIVDVAVSRLSDSFDIIPLMVSERLVDVSENCVGRLVETSGQFRSYNRHEGLKNKLVLSVFVRDWRERRIRFFWMDLFVNHRFIVKHLLEGKLQIYSLQSTVHMERVIIFHALPGEETQDSHPHLKWVEKSRYGEEFRAENM